MGVLRTVRKREKEKEKEAEQMKLKMQGLAQQGGEMNIVGVDGGMSRFLGGGDVAAGMRVAGRP